MFRFLFALIPQNSPWFGLIKIVNWFTSGRQRIERRGDLRHLPACFVKCDSDSILLVISAHMLEMEKPTNMSFTNQALVSYRVDKHTFTLWAWVATAPLLLITPQSSHGTNVVYQKLKCIVITSAEGGYVLTLVCLSVRRITEKVVNGFWRNFLEGVEHGPGTMSSILVTIRITVRIHESEVRNPDLLDYRKSP